MNVEERQAFKNWVIEREVKEKSNGFVEAFNSVLNIAEITGTTSSVAIFKTVKVTATSNEVTKFKKVLDVLKNTPNKMEELIKQIGKDLNQGLRNLASDLTSSFQPSRQLAGYGNVKINTNANTVPKDINITFKRSNNKNNTRGNNGGNNDVNQNSNYSNQTNQRIVLEYDKGEFWEALKTRRQEPRLIALSRNAKADIRIDNNGFFYKFDPMHKTFKIHLHKYQHLGSNKYKLIEEANPATGEGKVIPEEVERW